MVELPASFELREMIPATRNAWPMWEISYAGAVVGWVESRRIGHGRPGDGGSW